MVPKVHMVPDHIDLVQLDRESNPTIREQTLLDWVPIEKMFIAAYGRPLSQKKVQKMFEKFDPNALGVILLSFRPNDTYAVLDGQHRIALAMQAGMTVLAARIYIDLTYEEEAKLYNDFATINQQSALDKFRAKLEAKDTTALDIQRILNHHGLEVATSGPALGKVQAVAALEFIYAQQGATTLDNVIGILHAGWEESKRAYLQQSLYGMMAFWIRYHDVVDIKRLQDVMKKYSPERIIQASMTHQSASIARSNHIETWGRAMVDAYNYGMRQHRLEEWEKKVVSEAGKLSYQQRSAAKRQSKAVATDGAEEVSNTTTDK